MAVTAAQSRANALAAVKQARIFGDNTEGFNWLCEAVERLAGSDPDADPKA